MGVPTAITYLRTLLAHGARAVVRVTRGRPGPTALVPRGVV
jgi:hypothetical protein